jgi:hypothetical protein
MKKLAFILTLAVVVAPAAPASGAVLLAKRCTSSCSQFQAIGKGWLSVVGHGAEWGTISSGTIWVRDRTGGSNPKTWVHGSGLKWTSIGDDGFRVTSTHSMTVSASTKFWIKLQGPGINVCGVFDGSGAVAGSGKYQIGSGAWHAWGRRATDLHF